MGMGYNLGYSFDCYNISKEIKNPDEQITLFGNPIPTKNMIKNIKKSGFKTIRFPVTWINFIDEKGNIDPIWISRVIEVVKWILESDMYCILNVYNDGSPGNWLSKGIESLDKYINLWSQIAKIFKDYDDHLIFEAMNEVEFIYEVYDEENDYSSFEYNFTELLIFSQAFIDTIRNSGGLNKERLLIITGQNAEFYSIFYTDFQIPKDPANKIALSIHYYFPFYFTKQTNNELYNDLYISSSRKWGDDNDYIELFDNLNQLKLTFVEKGIPIILGEVGVLTEEKKEIKSIREYLYALFSLSYEYEGFMSCLWDTSNKNTGNMNYYNRETNEWYDKILMNNFINISKGKYVKSSDYYILSNKETVYDSSNNAYGDIYFSLDDRKPMKVIINATLIGELYEDYGFSITSYDKDLNYFEILYKKKKILKSNMMVLIFVHLMLVMKIAINILI